MGLIPINGLDPRLQEQVLEHGELLDFKRGQAIFAEGARDGYVFYLLSGELLLESGQHAPVRVVAGEDSARRALAQIQPRRYTARALEQITVLRMVRSVLDSIVADEQTLQSSVAEIQVHELEQDEGDWMTRLLSSELFTRLPHENIQRFFAELEPQPAESGEIVVEQGSEGDYLYIVAEGQCEVVRRAPSSGQALRLAVLREGDAFGEEALISNSPRNASVKMLCDGLVMRLEKESFVELVSKPMLKGLRWAEACRLVAEGGCWVDVRFHDEHEADAIEGSLNIPLNVLRLEAAQLDRSRAYVTFCDTGARSSTGAFLLLRQGFEVFYLEGGLNASRDDEQPDADRDDAGSAEPAGGEPEPPRPEPIAPRLTLVESAPAPARVDAPSRAASRATAETARPAAAAPAAAAHAAAPRSDDRLSDELSDLRGKLTGLIDERDRAVLYGQQAANAARELKRRLEEAARTLQSERARREELEQSLAAEKAGGERELELERARLQGELEKASRRIEELREQRESEATRLGRERDRLSELVQQAEAQFAKLRSEAESADSARVALEIELRESLQEARAEAERERARADDGERALGELRARLEQAQASASEAEKSRDDRESALARATAEAEQHLAAQREALDEERARLAADVAQAQSWRERMEQELDQRRAELEGEHTAQQARAQALEGREAQLEARSASHEAEMERRERAVAEAESALSEEKASWQTRFDEAIEAERSRLETAHAEYKQEAERAAQRAAREQVEQQLGEAWTRYEALEQELNNRHAARLNTLTAEHAIRMQSMRNEYEARHGEQLGALRDAHRKLESENRRLHDAVTVARRLMENLRSEQSPTAHPAPTAAAAETPVAPEPDVPVIEVPGEAKRSSLGERERVISPAQIAEIRRKMEEKIRAAKGREE